MKSSNNKISVQDQYAKDSICFGCGPANENGLQIKSFRSSDGLEMWFESKSHHQAFPGVINGGIIGVLFDCHGNWAAAIALLDSGKYDDLPSTVTASYSVNLLKPTPYDATLHVKAKAIKMMDNKAEVEIDLYVDDVHCAHGSGLFVAVEEGHPAFHRW